MKLVHHRFYYIPLEARKRLARVQKQRARRYKLHRYFCQGMYGERDHPAKQGNGTPTKGRSSLHHGTMLSSVRRTSALLRFSDSTRRFSTIPPPSPSPPPDHSPANNRAKTFTTPSMSCHSIPRTDEKIGGEHMFVHKRTKKQLF